MSLQEKYDAAQSLLREHNDALFPPEPEGQASGSSEKPAGYVDPEQFISCIKAAGGTTEDRLKRFRYEEILQCLPEAHGVKPIPLAKELAAVFRGKEDTSTSDDKRPVSGRKAERMTPRELVEAFDPEEPSSPVAKRLQDISRGEAFIVYDTGRVINTKVTLDLLLEVKSGYEGRTTIDVNGAIKKVHKIGDLPDSFAEENPLYKNRPLRPDGTCDQTGRSWAGVSLETRQIVYLAVQTGEIKVSIDKAHDVLDMVLSDEDKLRKRYQKAAVTFDELKGRGQLPSLQVPLGSSDEGGGPKGPFDDGRKVEWCLPPGQAANYYVSNRRR